MDAPASISAESAFGIVWAFRFPERGAPSALMPQDLVAALAEPTGWTWVHLKLGDVRCRNWVSETAQISERAKELLLDSDEHLYLEHALGDFFGVVPDYQLEFARPTDEIGRLRFFAGERLLVTARRTPLGSVEAVRKAVEGGKRYSAPLSLLDAILDTFAAEISRRILKLREEMDKVEDRLINNELGEERQRISAARIQVVRMHRQLSQLRTLLHRFEPSIAADHKKLRSMIHNLGQKFDELDHDAGSINERARLLQDEAAARLNELTSRRLFALSLLTACLLPPTLVTGFFGMNTKDLPFQEIAGGTWYAFVAAAMAGGLTILILNRLRIL
jgi:zinc transporter